MSLSSLYLLAYMSLGVYPLFLAGWASNRKFGYLGAVRGIAQTVSYEISLAFILFSLLTKFQRLTIINTNFTIMITNFLFAGLLPLWIISCIAETNRTPFDFSEGESELVSGFNVEYGGSFFALIFIAEYGIILFLRFLTVSLFSRQTLGA